MGVYIQTLAGAGNISFVKGNEKQLKRCSVRTVNMQCTMYMQLDGMVDFAKEIKKLEKNSGKMENQIAKIQKQLGNEEFLQKASEELVEKTKQKLQEVEKEYAETQSSIERY